MEDIYVYWVVHGSPMWWPATVLEVHKNDEVKNSIYGHGRLLYNKYKSYSPEEASVRFSYSSKKGQIIMQEYESKCLEMTWAQNPPQKTSPFSNSSGALSSTHAHNIHAPSVSADDSKKTVAPPENIAATAAGEDQCQVAHRTSGTPASEIEAGKFKRMTSLFADRLLESTMEYLLNFKSSRFHEELSELVLHELRIDLVTEMHRNFRTTGASQPTISDDLYQKCIKSSVTCSLLTFSHIAQSVRQSNSDNNTVKFFPDYGQTQNPSTAAERFTIYFSGIHSLSKAIGFKDNRDFATLYWREKSVDNILYTRVIGTYCTSTSSMIKVSKSAHLSSAGTDHKHGETSSSFGEFHSQNKDSVGRSSPVHASIVHSDSEDIIFVGLSQKASLTQETVLKVGPSTQTGQTKPLDNVQVTYVGSGNQHRKLSPIDPVEVNSVALRRKRALRDEDTGSFLTSWECHSGSINVDAPHSEFFERKDKKLDGVFALRWESKQIPRTAAWTSDVFHSGAHKLGKLEVFVPWVLLTGNNCSQVGDILSAKEFKLRP